MTSLRPVGLIIGITALLSAGQAPAHETEPAGMAPLELATPVAAPDTTAAEPPLEPTPQGPCGPNSRPETGIQGRVSRADHESGLAAKGVTCNTKIVGSEITPDAMGSVGGFKVERYVDAAGHECAYYDSTLLYPTNILDLTAGVKVLDMSDPANPTVTESLVTPAMLSPHESLVLSKERGVLAAVLGNPAHNAGVVDLYDISEDCRHPVFKSSAPIGVFGHESGMAPDGRTFYSASPVSSTIVAVDISNLSAPVPIWTGNYPSHGLSISDDGNRAYVAGIGSGVIILDTSEIQARVLNPQVTEIARLQWESMSIPQNAIPITVDGHPFLVEVDEFGAQAEVGAARIIDIGDETNPRVISNLRLAVHQPENFAAQADDPGAAGPFQPLQGYAGHYCNVPQRTDPGVVGCSMIVSGLRLFDIRDPYNPREIAYFNAPVQPRTEPEGSNWAMSSPSFAPERDEVWYTDGYSGFYAVKMTNDSWPKTSKCGTHTARVIKGTRRKDRLLGSRISDAINGRRGDDRLNGRKTDDCLRGGAGADIVKGGAGDDRVRGGGDDDLVRGGGGHDRLSGSPGDDQVRGAAGHDLLRGGVGDDSLRGGSGDDRLQGGSGNDVLRGGPGKDTLICGAGRRDVAIAGRGDRVDGSCERLR